MLFERKRRGYEAPETQAGITEFRMNDHISRYEIILPERDAIRMDQSRLDLFFGGLCAISQALSGDLEKPMATHMTDPGDRPCHSENQ